MKMDITIKINMDNAAFEDCNGNEVSRILRKLATRINEATFTKADGGRLFDINGNQVGEWDVTE